MKSEVTRKSWGEAWSDKPVRTILPEYWRENPMSLLNELERTAVPLKGGVVDRGRSRHAVVLVGIVSSENTTTMSVALRPARRCAATPVNTVSMARRTFRWTTNQGRKYQSRPQKTPIDF